ncbi:MAG: hypothetical protein IPJ13_26880 [Saprospiraceae bacterium]|nr:hypothetical protein [Saprospiraceae bacterium]
MAKFSVVFLTSEHKNLGIKKFPLIAPLFGIVDFDMAIFQGMEIIQIYVDVNIVDGIYLDTDALRNWRPEYKNANFYYLKWKKFVCQSQVEKNEQIIQILLIQMT